MKRRKKSLQHFDLLKYADSHLGLLTPETSTVVHETSFDFRHGILLKSTPTNYFLRGTYKKSYAYHWLTYILPEIMETLVEDLETDSNEIIEKYGPKAKHEIECLIYQIRNLQCTVGRNNRMELFTGTSEDVDIWNNLILAQPALANRIYQVCFMYAQTYIYRKLASFLETKTLLRDYDLFRKGKIHLELLTEKLCLQLAEHFENWQNDFKTFELLIKSCLWANSYDAYRMFTIDNDTDLMDIFKHPKEHLLINHTDKVWKLLTGYRDQRIDIISANVGVDVFSDFLLADYLLEFKYASKIVFHIKSIQIGFTRPLREDLKHMLNNLLVNRHSVLKKLGIKWTKYIEDNKIEIAPEEYFWHCPHEYYKMKDYSQHLYDYLSGAGLLIFKGDYNYRKLVGDYKWDSIEKFITCLRGFQPTHILCLRIINSDGLCGMKFSVLRALKKNEPDWQYLLNYGTIQFEKSLACSCDLLRQQRATPQHTSANNLQHKLSWT